MGASSSSSSVAATAAASASSWALISASTSSQPPNLAPSAAPRALRASISLSSTDAATDSTVFSPLQTCLLTACMREIRSPRFSSSLEAPSFSCASASDFLASKSPMIFSKLVSAALCRPMASSSSSSCSRSFLADISLISLEALAALLKSLLAAAAFFWSSSSGICFSICSISSLRLFTVALAAIRT